MESNGTITSLQVSINSAAPYLYFPNRTCNALTKDLPITYSAKYGLYVWNVSDPQYAKIRTAPTFLTIVFRTSAQNLTIKVPFQLLNLTLGAPHRQINTLIPLHHPTRLPNLLARSSIPTSSILRRRLRPKPRPVVPHASTTPKHSCNPIAESNHGHIAPKL